MFSLFRKILIFPSMFSLLWASVVCCCLSHPAYGDDATQDDHHTVQDSPRDTHCESHNPEDEHSGENHECECPKLHGTFARDFDALKSPHTALFLIHHNVLAVNSFFSVIDDPQRRYYDRPPPDSRSHSLPLYLRYSVLRI